MNKAWIPANPCTNCTKRYAGERGKLLPCGNPEVCPEYHVYISKMAMAKELLEHLIANPSQGVGNCVTISSLKLKRKELEAGL